MPVPYAADMAGSSSSSASSLLSSDEAAAAQQQQQQQQPLFLPPQGNSSDGATGCTLDGPNDTFIFAPPLPPPPPPWPQQMRSSSSSSDSPPPPAGRPRTVAIAIDGGSPSSVNLATWAARNVLALSDNVVVVLAPPLVAHHYGAGATEEKAREKPSLTYPPPSSPLLQLVTSAPCPLHPSSFFTHQPPKTEDASAPLRQLDACKALLGEFDAFLGERALSAVLNPHMARAPAFHPTCCCLSIALLLLRRT